MTTTRRNFLKWSGISALGTIAFVGCGIPERELRVQSPAQMPEDLVSGLEAWYATACGQCGTGEGIIVRVIEGRAIKIEGNPDHPMTQGKSSVRCQAGLQALYNPDRITTPMRRVGARGSGEFETIAWDVALEELATHLKNFDPKSAVMVTAPLRGSIETVVSKFTESHGCSHISYEPLEQTVMHAAVREVFGQERLPEFDIANADYVLNFGADFLSTWLAPVRYSRAYGDFRQGNHSRGTMVQIEPRLSMTGANADRWVYVNPGWEGILAMSIAYILMSEHSNEINVSAVNSMTNGGGAAVLSSFDPDTEVVRSTGVSADIIRKLASELVSHPHSLVLGGGSAAAHTNGLFNLSAIYGLNHLIGNVGRAGSVLFNPKSPLDDARPGVTSFADWENLNGKIHNGEVSLMLVHEANPVYGLPASASFTEGLDKVSTIVSFSSFMDETTALSDLILPDQVYLEAWGDDVPEPGPGYQAITLQQPVVYPFQSETRPFGNVLLDVAQRLGGPVAEALPWSNMRDVIRASAQKLHALGRGSVQGRDFEGFWNTILQRGGWWDVKAKGLPSTAVPLAPQHPVTPEFEGSAAEYPFYLIPFSSLSLTDGKGANLPWLQATPDPLTTTAWHTWAEINIKLSNKLGIEEGDELLVESPSGSIKVLAYPHPAAPPDVISIPTGQGHTEYGNFEVGPDLFRNVVGKGRGANVLSILATNKKDNDTGALAWAANRVKISKTGEWVRLSKFEGTVPPTFPDHIIPISRTG